MSEATPPTPREIMASGICPWCRAKLMGYDQYAFHPKPCMEWEMMEGDRKTWQAKSAQEASTLKVGTRVVFVKPPLGEVGPCRIRIAADNEEPDGVVMEFAAKSAGVRTL